MRKYRLIKYGFKILSILLIISCNNEKKDSENRTNRYDTLLEFENETHDFGRIIATDSLVTSFKFSNKGQNPLVIRHVKSSCGCTIPEWPMNPIQINKEGKIRVFYDAKNLGRFNKTIIVFYNGKDSPKKLIIKGQVVYSKDSEKSKLGKK